MRESATSSGRATLPVNTSSRSATRPHPCVLAGEKTAPATSMSDQMQARMQTIQARMHAMQQTENGEARMPMMPGMHGSQAKQGA